MIGVLDLPDGEALWLFVDETYEAFHFNGTAHVSIAEDPDTKQHTVSVFSFSKTAGMAGFRIGYLAAPEYAVAKVRNVATSSIYSPSRVTQAMLCDALDSGSLDQWLDMQRSIRARDWGMVRGKRMKLIPTSGLMSPLPRNRSFEGYWSPPWPPFWWIRFQGTGHSSGGRSTITAQRSSITRYSDIPAGS